MKAGIRARQRIGHRAAGGIGRRRRVPRSCRAHVLVDVAAVAPSAIIGGKSVTLSVTAWVVSSRRARLHVEAVELFVSKSGVALMVTTPASDRKGRASGPSARRSRTAGGIGRRPLCTRSSGRHPR